MSPRYSPGQILLASLVFSSQLGTKNRPVLVVHDGGDDDLLVAPITSRVGRSQHDIFLNGWQQSGLRLPSVARLEKLATIEKTTIVRTLGQLLPDDRAQVKLALQRLTPPLSRPGEPRTPLVHLMYSRVMSRSLWPLNPPPARRGWS